MKGIFNSDKGNLVRNIADVPCDVVQNLESDADAAEQFVSQIQAGQVPSLITDLPEEAISEFGAIIGVATQVVDVAEAAVTDVVSIFDDIEDGNILDAVTDIPKDIINGITEGWNDLTSEVGHVWSDVTCWIDDDCTTTSTAPPCGMPSAAATTTSPVASSSYVLYTTLSPAPMETSAPYTTSTDDSDTATDDSDTATDDSDSSVTDDYNTSTA